MEEAQIIAALTGLLALALLAWRFLGHLGAGSAGRELLRALGASRAP